MNRRAIVMTWQRIGFLIIALAVLFLVINLLSDYFIAMDEKARVQTCRNSVIAHSAMKMKYADFSRAIRCPAENITAKGDEEEIMRELAERMASCWDMYGQGRLNLFDEPLIERNYCGLCYHVTFDREIKIDADRFFDFLGKRKYSREETYLQHLVPYSSNFIFEKEFIDLPDNMQPVIDTGEDYGIFFVYKKESNNLLIRAGQAATGTVITAAGAALIYFTGGWGTAVGGKMVATGVLTGLSSITGISEPFSEETWQSAVLLYPYDQLEELNCEELPVKQGKT